MIHKKRGTSLLFISSAIIDRKELKIKAIQRRSKSSYDRLVGGYWRSMPIAQSILETGELLSPLRIIITFDTAPCPLDLCHIIGLRPQFSALRALSRSAASIHSAAYAAALPPAIKMLMMRHHGDDVYMTSQPTAVQLTHNSFKYIDYLSKKNRTQCESFIQIRCCLGNLSVLRW